MQDPPKPGMTLVAWRPVRRGKLLGFATVMLPIGLKIVDISIFQGNSGPWAALPRKPVMKEGKQALTPDNKPQFQSILEWRDRQLADRFSDAVVALVRALDPEFDISK